MTAHGYKVGDKIKFKGEVQRYTVRAASARFLVCTKPMNARKTVIYCTVDFHSQERGTLGYVFNPHDYTTDEGCQAALAALEAGTVCLSRRNFTALDIQVAK